jgi:hypothetical protein
MIWSADREKEEDWKKATCGLGLGIREQFSLQ